jgi:hypothetical protein
MHEYRLFPTKLHYNIVLSKYKYIKMQFLILFNDIIMLYCSFNV